MSSESDSFLSKMIKNPIFLGIMIGVLAAVVQALLFAGGGPEAYGVCIACHTRDLTNDIYNEATDPDIGLAPISANASAAVMTIVGIIVGAFLAAKINKEFKIKKGSILSYIVYIIGGIAVLIFALLLGGCPYRAALRFAYGDIVALFGILAMAAGVFVGVKLVMMKMNKEDV